MKAPGTRAKKRGTKLKRGAAGRSFATLGRKPKRYWSRHRGKPTDRFHRSWYWHHSRKLQPFKDAKSPPLYRQEELEQYLYTKR